MKQRVILASGSPRRRELLGQIGLEPEILPSAIEEKVTETAPDRVVESLSLQKAGDVASLWRKRNWEPGTVILGADTVVAADGKILGKPKSGEEAAAMLDLLQGRTHQVCTGVTIMRLEAGGTFQTRTFSVETRVEVYPMTQKEIQRYVATGEPMDKAGAYGIQGRFAAYIKKIDGDYSNVVGLPVGRVYQELKAILEEA